MRFCGSWALLSSMLIVPILSNVPSYNDFLETDLSKELENGRLVRLMMKLGFINERPE